ncbi:MAG: hypothetical protein M1609_02465 [Firmicutes bacterium]|nr:hypothetical protein [Bacillota bacterium]
MILVMQKRLFIAAALVLFIILVGLAAGHHRFSGVAAGDFNYRVFVAGVGTVEGKWSGDTGIAVIGLEARPAPEQGNELKVIDLLIANSGSVKVVFRSDITLINRQGRRYSLKAKGQPEVAINPGALSQGTVIISVPSGIPDNDWLLEIRGGNLKDDVVLPFRVIKVVSGE